MDLYALAFVIGSLALLVGVVVGGLVWSFGRTLSARDGRDKEAERRHAADLRLLNATILSLRAELAEEEVEDADGSGAARGLVDAASGIAGAPGELPLWSDGAAPASGDAPPTPAAPPGPAA